MSEKHLGKDIGVSTLENIDPSEHIVYADDVSYGESGIRGLIGSPYVLGAAMLAALGGFSFGYDQGVISLILVMPQFAARFPEVASTHARSGFYNGLMTGMLALGAFFGCLFYPYLADRISRKRALTCAVIVFDFGAIIQTAAPNYTALVVGRALGGIGCGTLAMGAPLYISEIAPPNIRGSLLVLEQVAIVIGAIIAYWITYGTRNLTGEAAFRLPFGLQMVVATALGVGINFLPYTPRWLALVGRDDESLQSLAKLRALPADDSRVQTEWRGIRAEVAFQHKLQEQKHPGKRGLALELVGWRDLFTRRLWRRSFIAFAMQFFQQFSGINAFVYYAPKLFVLLGQDYEMSLILSGMVNICQLVANLPTFLFLDVVGRKKLTIIGCAIMCCAHIIMAILTAKFNNSWTSHPAAAWVSVALVYIYTLAFAMSLGPVAWAVPAEVFPNWCRSKGVGLSVATNWGTTFIIGLVVPIMIETIGYGTFVFFAVFCGLAVVWTIFFLPNIEGKSLEQMDEVFHDTSSAEETQMKLQIAAEISREDKREGSIARRASGSD